MPKVFISYSYDDEEHKKWVFDLACRLRTNGVDAIFDQFETRLGSDLALFMEQGLNASNRVICICSELYNQKANSGQSGVGYEKRIICKELMKDSSTAWVIPLIRKNEQRDKIPIFLSSLKYISFLEDDLYQANYWELLRELYDQSNLPPLGKNPFDHNGDVLGIIEEKNKIIKALSFINKKSGIERFNYLSNSGLFTIGMGSYQFNTYWSTAGNYSIHAMRDYVQSIACTTDEINADSFNLSKYDFSSRARTAQIGETVIWVNKNGKILFTKVLSIVFENNQTHWLHISYQILEKD